MAVWKADLEAASCIWVKLLLHDDRNGETGFSAPPVAATAADKTAAESWEPSGKLGIGQISFIRPQKSGNHINPRWHPNKKSKLFAD